MSVQGKRKDWRGTSYMGRYMAVAFSVVFLCACGARETVGSSPPAATPPAIQTAVPQTAVAAGTASADKNLSPSASETAQGGWELILVNPSHTLPADFSVKLADFEGGQVDRRILANCEAMFADAEEDGVTLTLVDAYRSRETQSGLFEEKVESYLDKGYSRRDAEAEAATITARPGTSEHQTGLALDIVTPSHTSRNAAFDETGAFEWLEANAGGYGFILRYPEGKTDVTGVIYEPWHWRFVGETAAAEIKDAGQCLEEYLGAEG